MSRRCKSICGTAANPSHADRNISPTHHGQNGASTKQINGDLVAARPVTAATTPDPPGNRPALDNRGAAAVKTAAMNYRHAFHAGNFADVLKHAVLGLVIAHLKRKEKPFCVLDTHAGRGLYHLDGPEAQRTGEWQRGIARLMGRDAPPLDAAVTPLLEPYLDAVRTLNPDGRLTVYPGSPRLALDLMRDHDRLVANELHPDDAQALRQNIGPDRRARVLTLDGWAALKANLPPKERRGVILIDPPFEEAGEFERLAEGLAAGVRRFATGTYILWIPIKNRRPVEAFEADLGRLGLAKLIWAELHVGSPTQTESGFGTALTGTGLAILNPPFGLSERLKVLLAFLAARLCLAPDNPGHWALRTPGHST